MHEFAYTCTRKKSTYTHVCNLTRAKTHEHSQTLSHKFTGGASVRVYSPRNFFPQTCANFPSVRFLYWNKRSPIFEIPVFPASTSATSVQRRRAGGGVGGVGGGLSESLIFGGFVAQRITRGIYACAAFTCVAERVFMDMFGLSVPHSGRELQKARL